MQHSVRCQLESTHRSKKEAHKVGQMHMSIRVQKYVVRLDIPVHYALAMNIS